MRFSSHKWPYLWCFLCFGGRKSFWALKFPSSLTIIPLTLSFFFFLSLSHSLSFSSWTEDWSRREGTRERIERGREQAQGERDTENIEKGRAEDKKRHEHMKIWCAWLTFDTAWLAQRPQQRETRKKTERRRNENDRRQRNRGDVKWRGEKRGDTGRLQWRRPPTGHFNGL